LPFDFHLTVAFTADHLSERANQFAEDQANADFIVPHTNSNNCTLPTMLVSHEYQTDRTRSDDPAEGSAHF
jgi:hypothetical protein